MKTGKTLSVILPALILLAPAGPAVAGKAAVAGEVAVALTSEIVTPIIAEQIMQGFGISGGSDAIDYDRIRDIVEEVVADQNKKQTMSRLLGNLGGVNKTVADLLKYARADKKSATAEESTNDRKVRELIDGLWTPLNTVLAEFEGKYTGESHGLLRAYGEASHLKLSMTALQLVRAKSDLQAFEKRVTKAKGKNKKTLNRLIRDRKQAVKGHAAVYASQAAAEMKFVHALSFNDRAKMTTDYIKRNIDDFCRVPMRKPAFRDRADWDPYDPAGGETNRYGAARYYLRNTMTDKPFPSSSQISRVRGPLPHKAFLAAMIKGEEFYEYKKWSTCDVNRKNYLETALPVAMFYQTEARFGIREIYDVLERQRKTALKFAKTLKIRKENFRSPERTENLKLAKAYSRP